MRSINMYDLKINWKACQPIVLETVNQEGLVKYQQMNKVTTEEMSQMIAKYDLTIGELEQMRVLYHDLQNDKIEIKTKKNLEEKVIQPMTPIFEKLEKIQEMCNEGQMEFDYPKLSTVEHFIRKRMDVLTQITALGVFKATEIQHIYRMKMDDLYPSILDKPICWRILHQVIWEELIQKPITKLMWELYDDGKNDAGDFLNSLENDIATELNDWQTPPMAELFRNQGEDWLKQYAIDLYPEITEEIEKEAYSMSVGRWSSQKIGYLLKNHPKKILEMLENEKEMKNYLTEIEEQAEKMYQGHLEQLTNGTPQNELEKYQSMNELMAEEKVVYSLICT